MPIDESKLYQPAAFFSLLLLKLGENLLDFFVSCDSNSIGDHCSNQARVESKEKAFYAVCSENLFATADKSSIWNQAMARISFLSLHLQFGLDDVLRVRTEPAADSSQRAHEKTLWNRHVRAFRAYEIVL